MAWFECNGDADSAYVDGYNDGVKNGLLASMSNTNIKITYVHHIHSCSNTTSTANSSSESASSVTATYKDNYYSSTKSGCFTNPVYENVYGECGADSWTIVAEYAPQYDGGPPGYDYRCNKCGNRVTEWEWNSGGAGTCRNKVKKGTRLKGYSRTCGKTHGQIVQIIGDIL